ncbi:MAG: hypothetical protein K0R14_204 [Burkholderiales bacterium]|nr:hypothetical protein [Burkholderiales bacterium]
MHAGSCQCGQIRYKSTANIIGLYICHCLECQKQSASAFGITVEVLKEGFEVINGTPQFWNRISDSGNQIKCAFCPTCGSRLWHESTAESNTLSIKGGSLDEPVDISNAIHIWVKRKLSGIIIPVHAKQYPQEPN